MDILQIADLAKQGGRLASDKQWILADALASLTDTEITQVAVEAKRNEDTLRQYARAAERWPSSTRVEGVSFSAHRVALSWDDPRQLLVNLKEAVGSPTVQQVRQAMGLEGHPAIELLERGLRKLDRKVSAFGLRKVIASLLKFEQELDPGRSIAASLGFDGLDPVEAASQLENPAVSREASNLIENESEFINVEICAVPNCTSLANEDSTRCGVHTALDTPAEPSKEDDTDTSVWTPPIRTADIAGY